jgi:predicted RNA-binding Zn-ribbon protein involved in translation (DUF1610 family)
MPKCPKCGKEIDHLHYHVKELARADFDEGGNYWNWDILDTDYDTVEYCCPECGGVLFTNEDEALAFLS